MVEMYIDSLSYLSNLFNASIQADYLLNLEIGNTANLIPSASFFSIRNLKIFNGSLIASMNADGKTLGNCLIYFSRNSTKCLLCDTNFYMKNNICVHFEQCLTTVDKGPMIVNSYCR